jgi:CheY-like chemotaxis protein
MPKMNGFQVCKILKEDPDFKDTPIILVTSKGDKVGSKFVDALGITDFFTKPFQPDELLAKIRDVIDKRREAQPPPPPPPEPGRESRPAVLSPSPGMAPQRAGIEAIVRSIVEQVFDVFVKTKLPEIIQQELAKAQHGAVTAGIQGNLASVRIAEVMQMLGLQCQTGRVVINRPGDAVEIYFKDGLVVFASENCNGNRTAVEALLRKSCRIDEDSLRHVMRIAEMTSQPIDIVLFREKMIDHKAFAECLRRHTESAVYKVMAWKDGDFYFEKTSSPVFAAPVQIKVDDLLMEGARRSDEWSLIQKRIPDFNIVFEPMIGNAEELTTRGMSDADLMVFSLINGRRTIQEIIEMLSLLSVNLIRRKR